MLFHLTTIKGLSHYAKFRHNGQFLIKRNKLTCGSRFGSIEIKTPKQLFKDLFILEKDFLVFFKPLFGLE